ncbi:MAG: hypothetical protein MUQ26_06750 [Armatimonadetes bacterium]|nr:hypothetical protein [Armatimonadota bacterium]
MAHNVEIIERVKSLPDRVAAEIEGLSEDECIRAAGHLSDARAMYALAIEEIARALRRIEPVSWELP